MSSSKETRIREGFPKQRLVVIPPTVTKRCRSLPIVSELYVTDIGSYPSAPHHYVERRQGISAAVMIYCLSGRGSIEIDNTTHKIRFGQLVIIPPNTPHIYQAEQKDPWSICWIHFSGTQTQALSDSLKLTKHKPSLYVPDTRIIRDAFENVYACLNYHYTDAGLLAMSSELLRLFSLAKLHQGFPGAQRQSAEKRVVSTLAFMEQHLHMPLTLDEMAAHSGQSLPYFTRLFRQRTNQSPMAYFIQLKIRKACELLDQTDSTIREIASQLGYDDPYYFSRIFKKTQGCSPAAYRKSQGVAPSAYRKELQD